MKKQITFDIKTYATEIHSEKTIPLGILGFDISKEEGNKTVIVKIQKGVVVDVIALPQNDFNLIFNYLKLFTNEDAFIIDRDPDEREHKHGL